MESLAGKSFFSKDFSKQDLQKADLRNAKFVCCNFNDADLTEADCSGAEFIAGSMVGTKCTHTNFANARIATKFWPRDAYGMTLTLSCKTFKGTSISRMWWYGWLYFAMMMTPEQENGRDPRDKLIGFLGTETWMKLKKLFEGREI